MDTTQPHGGNSLAAALEQFGERLMSRLDERFEKIDGRFERIDGRFEKIEDHFGEVRERLSGLEQGQQALAERQGALEQGQQALAERQGALEQGQQALAERQGALEQGQQALVQSMTTRFNGLEDLIHRMGQHQNEFRNGQTQILQRLTGLEESTRQGFQKIDSWIERVTPRILRDEEPRAVAVAGPRAKPER